MSRIIVIEDDRAILRGLKDNLEHESYEVLTATDGEQGYRLIQEHNPDLIVLDVMMPGMNGYQVCSALKNDARYSKIPIVLFSGNNQEYDKIVQIIMADAYIAKPFESSNLLFKIEELLKKSS